MNDILHRSRRRMILVFIQQHRRRLLSELLRRTLRLRHTLRQLLHLHPHTPSLLRPKAHKVVLARAPAPRNPVVPCLVHVVRQAPRRLQPRLDEALKEAHELGVHVDSRVGRLQHNVREQHVVPHILVPRAEAALLVQLPVEDGHGNAHLLLLLARAKAGGHEGGVVGEDEGELEVRVDLWVDDAIRAQVDVGDGGFAAAGEDARGDLGELDGEEIWGGRGGGHCGCGGGCDDDRSL